MSTDTASVSLTTGCEFEADWTMADLTIGSTVTFTAKGKTYSGKVTMVHRPIGSPVVYLYVVLNNGGDDPVNYLTFYPDDKGKKNYINSANLSASSQ